MFRSTAGKPNYGRILNEVNSNYCTREDISASGKGGIFREIKNSNPK